jgi:hypothetical protein
MLLSKNSGPFSTRSAYEREFRNPDDRESQLTRRSSVRLASSPTDSANVIPLSQFSRLPWQFTTIWPLTAARMHLLRGSNL